MQEVITYSIGVVVALIIGRYIYYAIKGGAKDSGCTSCSCCPQSKNCGESK